MIAVFKKNDLNDIAVSERNNSILATASAEKQEDIVKNQLNYCEWLVCHCLRKLLANNRQGDRIGYVGRALQSVREENSVKQ